MKTCRPTVLYDKIHTDTFSIRTLDRPLFYSSDSGITERTHQKLVNENVNKQTCDSAFKLQTFSTLWEITSCFPLGEFQLSHQEFCQISVQTGSRSKTLPRGGWNFLFYSSTSAQKLAKTIFLVFLTLLAMAPAHGRSLPDANASSDELSSRPPLSLSCYRHFGHRVQSCVDPFLSLLEFYDSKVDQLSHPGVVAKHICVEYQMVLLCLHSALTDCPTMKNLRKVQSTLDSDWVVDINELCAIQSKDKTENDDEDLTNYIYKQKSSNKMDSYEIAKQILEASTKTRRELEQEIISEQSDDEITDSLTGSHKRLTPTMDEELAIFRNVMKENKEDIEESKQLQLNIVNYIQSYNYNYKNKLNENIKGKSFGNSPISESSPAYVINSSAVPRLDLGLVAVLCVLLQTVVYRVQFL